MHKIIIIINKLKSKKYMYILSTIGQTFNIYIIFITQQIYFDIHNLHKLKYCISI